MANQLSAQHYVGGDEQQMAPMRPRPVSESVEPQTSMKGTVALVLVVLVVLVGAIVGLVVGLNVSAEEPSAQTSLGLQTPTFPPTPEPTNFPIAAVTPRPTFAPTGFPTSSAPTTPTVPQAETARPTVNPSANPTIGPTEECESADSVCGCSLVQSKLVDVIIIVDESGSVGQSNYNTMKDAIQEFVLDVDPAYDLVDGTRFTYIEFSSDVNENLNSFTRFATPQAFNDAIEGFRFGDGQTNHRLAIEKAHDILRDNIQREFSEIAVLMLTDGVPFSTGNPNPDGVQALKNMRQEFPFTFFYLPINPENAGNNPLLDTFNAAVASDGLAAEELVILPVESFDDLSETLTGGTFSLPLGPCVTPPTFSEGDRRLLAAQSGSADNTNSVVINP